MYPPPTRCTSAVLVCPSWRRTAAGLAPAFSMPTAKPCRASRREWFTTPTAAQAWRNLSLGVQRLTEGKSRASGSEFAERARSRLSNNYRHARICTKTARFRHFVSPCQNCNCVDTSFTSLTLTARAARGLPRSRGESLRRPVWPGRGARVLRTLALLIRRSRTTNAPPTLARATGVSVSTSHRSKLERTRLGRRATCAWCPATCRARRAPTARTAS